MIALPRNIRASLEPDPYEFFTGRARVICKNIDSISDLWDEHIRPVRDAAARLSVTEDLAEHGIEVDENGKIEDSSQKLLNKVLDYEESNGKYIDSADLLGLNQTMCELGDGYVELRRAANKHEIADGEIGRRLSEMRQKLEDVNEGIESVIALINIKLEELTAAAKNALSDLEIFFSGENNSDRVDAVAQFVDFVKRLILRPEIFGMQYSDREADLMQLDEEEIAKFAGLVQDESGLDRARDNDILEQCKLIITEELPRLAQEQLAEYLEGAEAWFVRAKNVYKEALKPYQNNL